MRNLLFALFLSFMSGALTVYAIDDTKQKGGAIVEIPAAPELAFVIASLTDLDKGQGGQIDRTTDYYKAIETYFAPYKTMAIFQKLKGEYNLPRLVGNAADFEIDQDNNITEVDQSGSLWRDAKGDTFRKYLSDIQAFAQKSNFMKFYQDQQATYAKYIGATEAFIEPDEMREWLEHEFTARPGAVRLYASPLTSGLHWTTLFKKNQRIWITAPKFEKLKSASSIDKMLYVRSVFTEIDHGYVNPASANYVERLNAAIDDLSKVATERAAKAYPSAELQFNEYMTWAVFLIYASEQMDEKRFADLNGRVVKFMRDRRGFHKFDTFTKQVFTMRNQSKDTPLEKLIVDLIQWFETIK